ncbi:YcdB/YcdC domain-containing protein [Bacillus atrophaeus]|uniref:YcdB/YcdC domain-containing protein n=1 Tax=Bacillus atrophaeus TaxID=1452 RepID=UPI00228213BC|nr:YcdB/YcdC domain-containing protein [Bacillus atrophaeus]MCY8946485.1 DUF4901 domain-containing protein [Bacillus atrophaeus]
MVKEQLKKKAMEIGDVPPHYELEIEDYDERQKKKAKAYFIWRDPEHTGKKITVELGMDGSLLRYSTTASPMPDKRLSDAELKLTALQFAAGHHPDTFMYFHFQAKEERKHHVRFIYIKKVLELPLPNSGFLIDISRSGRVVNFLYYGGEGRADIPEEFVEKDKVISHYVNTLSFKLVYDVIDNEKAPRLVYEPIMPGYSYPADVSAIVPDQNLSDERMEQGAPLPLLEKSGQEPDIYQMMGFTNDMKKVGERDFGDVYGTTWRKGEAPERKDLSIGSYFESRNQNTMKMKTDKKTGNITAFISFVKQQGDIKYSKEECETIALRFLYALFPRAREFFRVNPSRTDEKGRIRNHFSVWYKDVPLRFGAARIIVNRETGHVDAYMAPDIDPEVLEKIKHRPDVPAEEARAAFLSAFDLKLEWQPDFSPHSEYDYKLVYTPVYPSYIDAHKRRKKRL